MKEFDKVYKHYDRFIDLFNLNKMHEIKKLLKLKGNEIIADFGGGTGRLAEYLSESCKTVYVLDESEGMLSRIKKKENITPIQGDILKTNFYDNSIDIIILNDVLHHIENQKQLIDEIFRVLKNKGSLVIVDFEKTHYKTKLLKSFEYILFGKLYFKTRKEVLELIGQRFSLSDFVDGKYYFLVKGEKNV